MQKTDLRNLVNEIFLFHGIHPSWLRKLLPEGLKDTSKTRLSYLQMQEIEKERQRLLQKASESHQKSSIKGSIPPDGSIMVSAKLRTLPSPLKSQEELESEDYTASDVTAMVSETPVREDPINMELKTTQDRLYEANKKIERLEADVQHLSKLFVAKAYLQAAEQDILLVANIDPVRKVIMSIQVDKSY
jgi:hypothetical protein